MSERRYDSDAQFISTPKQTKHSLLTTLDTERGASPLGQSYSLEELDRPDENSKALSRPGVLDMTGSQAACDFLNSVRWSSSGFQISSMPHIADTESTLPIVEDSMNTLVHGRGVNITTPLSMSCDIQTTEMEAISTPAEGSRGKDGQCSRRMSESQGYIEPERFSDSLIANATQVVLKKRSQPSREPSSEAHSIHLTDMNISKMLASPSSTPRILSQPQSLDEDRQAGELGSRVVSNQFLSYNGQSSQRSLLPGQGQGPPKFDIPWLSHSKKASSMYSRQTSLSSAIASPNLQIPPLQSLSDVGKSSIKSGGSSLGANKRRSVSFVLDASSSAQNMLSNKPNYPKIPSDLTVLKVSDKKSRFVEHFDMDNSNAPIGTVIHQNKAETSATPRKISVGWMSGGRRLGYGYSLISEDEGDQTETSSLRRRKRQSRGNRVTFDDQPYQQTSGKGSRESSRSIKGPESITGVSSIIDRFGLRNISGATASLRTENSDNLTDIGPGSSSLWSRLTGRKEAGSPTVPVKDQCAKRDSVQGSEDGSCLHDKESAVDVGPFHESHPLVQGNGPSANGFRVRKRHKPYYDPSRPVQMILPKDTERELGPHAFRGSIVPGAEANTPHCPEPNPDLTSSGQSESDNVAEDWASLYQDCLEILSDPEYSS